MWRSLASPFVMGVIGCLLTAGVAILLMALATTHPEAIRVSVALPVLIGMIMFALRRPRAAVVAAIAFLTVIALLRRLLIPIASWTSYDALLLVGPAVALLLVVRRREQGEQRQFRGALPAIVVVLLSVASLEVFNPAGSGLLAEATGFFFLASPLVWFFVGHRWADDHLTATLVTFVLVAGCATAVYGLAQSTVGFPAWDQAWITLNSGSYAALNVGGVVRAFSSFSSSAEYALFEGAAVAVVIAKALRGQLWMLLTVPLLGTALILESGRTAVVLTLSAALVVIALRTGSVWVALGTAVVGLTAVGILDQLLAPRLLAFAVTADPLLSHQIGGLADPFNADRSTLLGHIQLVVEGFSKAIAHPLGFGPASTTLAGPKLADSSNSAEMDIPNEFLSLGVVGGLLYAALVVLSLAKASRLALYQRDAQSLALIGILVVTFGQWLNGGYYALSPIVWLLIGRVSRSEAATAPEQSV